MQATVLRFDETSGDGSVVTDDGRELAFPASAARVGGLLRPRPGQRVHVRQEPGDAGHLEVTRVSVLP